MTVFEVLADEDTQLHPDAATLRWPKRLGEPSEITTDLDWNLTQLGCPDPVSRDLVRVAAGAYLLDRSVKRSSTYFSRRLELIVQLDQPALFLSPAGQRLADLMAWLTGDAWTITPVENGSQGSIEATSVEAREAIMLLSGASPREQRARLAAQ